MDNASKHNVTSSIMENLSALKTVEQNSVSDSCTLFAKKNATDFSAHVSGSTDNHKEAASQRDTLKSSKVSSSLDSYCSTDILNESADFAECKVRPKVKQKNKKELYICEICKEDITHLDIYNRSVHLNNCIDKQVSSTSSALQSFESENIFILECPLCFRHFSSPELRSNHIKKCAKSKGLSVQSVIQALELQERHALEREALGLPVKPVKPVKSHKNLSSKRTIVEPKSKAQSDIQLAKALSLSLSSQGDSNSENASAVSLRPPTDQQNPGKKVSRCKKGSNVTPLLVLRTEEERKTLLLDKVAAIVAPVESIDEVSLDDAEENSCSKKLQNNQCEVASEIPVLWNLSGASSEKFDYYVNLLDEWIKPCDVEVGTKLHHLSQIPGHEIVTQVPCEYTFSVEEENVNTCIPSSGHFPIRTDTLSHHTEQPASAVLKSLQTLVASSWMSDVEVEVACGTVIPAHKLILSVRCPSLKKDMDFCYCDRKAQLKWENISFSTALQFLNFLYTGNIDVKENMVSDLLYLAKKYEVLDLKTFLKASWKAHSSDASESNENFFQYVDVQEKASLDPSSQCSKITENLPSESQDTDNEDLEIVYNCINSTFRPTQFSPSKPCTSSQEDSPKTSSRKDFSFSPLNTTVSSSEIMAVSPEKHIDEHKACHTTSPIPFSVKDNDQNHNAHNAEQEEYRSTSPVIFDVKDSDQDESASDGESSQILSFSQRLEKSPTNPELDQAVINCESNSSEESIKILKSSFVSFSESWRQPEKRDSQSPAKTVDSKESIVSSPNNSSAFNGIQSSQKFVSERLKTLESSGFYSDILSDGKSPHLDLDASDSDVLSKVITIGERKTVACDSNAEKVSDCELESIDRCISTSKDEEAKGVSGNNSPYNYNTIRTHESSNTVLKDYRHQTFSGKRSSCTEDDSFIIPKKLKFSSPQRPNVSP